MTRLTKLEYSAGGWLLIIAVALSGCAETAGRPLAVADSAGVEVVTNLPGSIEAVETWSLSAEPVHEIGAGASPDVPLFHVTDVAPREETGSGAGSPTCCPRSLVHSSCGERARSGRVRTSPPSRDPKCPRIGSRRMARNSPVTGRFRA